MKLGVGLGGCGRFTDELADNVSFGELGPWSGLSESLEVLPGYFVGGGRLGFLIGRGGRGVAAGEVAVGNSKAREVRCVEVQEMAIEIRLGEFTNEEIGKEMAALA